MEGASLTGLGVFETKDGHSKQRPSDWVEGWNSTNGTGEFDQANPTQVEYVLEVYKALGVDLLQYDATRGELDLLKDAKQLPDYFEGVAFTKKRMVAMATVLSDQVSHSSIRLLDDPRQTN